MLGGIPKIGTGNVFNGGATTNGSMDEWMPPLDSARRTGLESSSNELQIRKVGGCFSHRSRTHQRWDKMEDIAGLGIILRTFLD